MKSLTKESAYNAYADRIRVYKAQTKPGFNNALKRECEEGHFDTVNVCRANLRTSGNKFVIDEMDEVFTAALESYIDELFAPEFKEDFEFCVDWSINVYRNGRATPSHNHNEAFVGMTYYAEGVTEGESDVISTSLTNFNHGDLIIHNSDGFAIWDRYSKDERGFINVTPEAGTVVVFPGHAPHFSVPDKKTRYCIAAFVFIRPKSSKKIDFGE